MSQGFDLVVVTVVWIISFVIHRVSIDLFGPASGLHELASDGTAIFNGAQRMDLWFEILAVWVPLLACGGIIAWAIIRAYRRQAVTATRTPGP